MLTVASSTTSPLIGPDYQMMHGASGLTDGQWSLAVQILGLVLALLIGLTARRDRSPVVAAALLGLAVDAVALIVIGGGGPAAFVGLFMFPALFAVVALIGRGIRSIAARARRRRVAELGAK